MRKPHNFEIRLGQDLITAFRGDGVPTTAVSIRNAERFEVSMRDLSLPKACYYIWRTNGGWVERGFLVENKPLVFKAVGSASPEEFGVIFDELVAETRKALGHSSE